MKKIRYAQLLIALSMMCPLKSIAQERINSIQAFTVSANYLKSLGVEVGRAISIEEDYLNDTLCLYCVHYNDGRWTVVSASTRAYPVLATGVDFDMTLLDNNTDLKFLFDRFKKSILYADNGEFYKLNS